MDQQIKSYSVKNYLTSIKRTLDETPPVWVHGVITQIVEKQKIVYLSIADFEEGNVKPIATIALSCFAGQYAKLRFKTENAEKPFILKEQIKVCLLVKADLYIPFGKFQGQILDIDPVYTIGELALTRSAILKRLANDGLLDKNKSLELAQMPLKVGLITGETTAAYKDFTTRLAISPFKFTVFPSYAKMQGNDTESTVIEALETLKQNQELDVVCIVRGGGSKTDLNYFDSEALCRAVANYPIPVFTGIGHEIDKSLLDEVAYLSCITPTDCAKNLVERAQNSWYAMQTIARNINDCVKNELQHINENLTNCGVQLQQMVNFRIQKEKSNLAVSQTLLKKNASFVLKSETERIARNVEGLKQGTRKILEYENIHLKMFELKAKNADPETVLSKGYSMTLDKDGKFIKQIGQVKTGETIVTRVKDGQIKSIVQ